jgi:hypothetical protein
MRRLLSVLAGLLALTAFGAATPPPQWLVDQVRREINDDPSDPEGRPQRQPPASMFKRVDIDGDRIPDWQVNFDGEMAWCGTGGCRMELWLGRADGPPTPVWDAQVRQFKLRRGKTGATVDVDFHGTACGGYGAMECPRRYVWDGAEAAFVPAPNRRGDGFVAGLPVPPVDLSIAEAPADVKAQARRLIEACQASGGKLASDGIGVGRLPDLNGDGRREWFIGGEYADCGYETDPLSDPLRLIVLVSAPQGGFAPAWETSEAFIAFDIASRPAVMLQLDTDSNACGLQSSAACPRKPFRWDEASRKLVLAP